MSSLADRRDNPAIREQVSVPMVLATRAAPTGEEPKARSTPDFTGEARQGVDSKTARETAEMQRALMFSHLLFNSKSSQEFQNSVNQMIAAGLFDPDILLENQTPAQRQATIAGSEDFMRRYQEASTSEGEPQSALQSYARSGGMQFMARATRFDGSAESAIAIILRKEGLFSNHFADNGGATMMGISSVHWGQDYRNIMHLARTQGLDAARGYAIDFYERNFWDPVARKIDREFGHLPEAQRDALKFVAFDAHVNGGMNLVNRLLRESGGDIERFMEARLNHLQGLPDWKHFGRGWTNRVEGIGGQALGYMQGASPQHAMV